MDLLRRCVSGKRNRYTEGGYNLDLTYITPRIIASSYPASGLECAYRNKITDVARLLKTKHPGSFKVFNLSGRKYCGDILDSQVEDYTCWGDHHSPPFHILVEIVDKVYRFLEKKPTNVVLLHCNAGKGRTGTAICSVMLYGGMIDSAKDALLYYSHKRFNGGRGGVTQPAQVRYVYYFEEALKQKLRSAPPKVLRQIVINFLPTHKAELKPYIEIYQYNYRNLIYSSKVCYSRQSSCKCETDQVFSQAKICPNISIILSDDIYIKIFQNGSLKNSLLCRFSFNTAFIGKDNIIKLGKKEVDPDSIQRDKKFPENFQVQVYFSDVCEKCTNLVPMEKYCHNCSMYTKIYSHNWEKVDSILSQHRILKPEENIVGSVKEFEKIRKEFSEEVKSDYEYSDEENCCQEDSKEMSPCSPLTKCQKSSTSPFCCFQAPSIPNIEEHSESMKVARHPK